MLTDIARKVHHKLGDPDAPGSFSSSRRSLRFIELLRQFPHLQELRVLDLGGTYDFWRQAPVRPAHVTTMNLDDGVGHDIWHHHVSADACDLDSLDLCAGRYDLVVSNSLIEHVGGYHKRREFANVVHEAAPAHWVQTPNRYFPVEPHYIAPEFQFLPVRTCAQLVRRWPLAHERVYSFTDALDQVLTIELISATELRHLFPDSIIWHERLAGLSKSIVAIKHGPS